ncbi:hypothetical protein ONS95_001323 [Cadophora gregata]|uniref:uncharacterized protein n=1 Tax=Cadophora gregata TaxID=51156 RepID=UPI0026DB2400|nr:uncharacterized protein ONS95_001323 [Cadophora gregata]KAK0101866.1 hypothetical protein ONS96_005841 [Cadophora gregata f. sp. sojae]KAK0129397.1 hypothetical protein ONS95_001323 [Cadophora gregata]
MRGGSPQARAAQQSQNLPPFGPPAPYTTSRAFTRATSDSEENFQQENPSGSRESVPLQLKVDENGHAYLSTSRRRLDDTGNPKLLQGPTKSVMSDDQQISSKRFGDMGPPPRQSRPVLGRSSSLNRPDSASSQFRRFSFDSDGDLPPPFKFMRHRRQTTGQTQDQPLIQTESQGRASGSPSGHYKGMLKWSS